MNIYNFIENLLNYKCNQNDTKNQNKTIKKYNVNKDIINQTNYDILQVSELLEKFESDLSDIIPGYLLINKKDKNNFKNITFKNNCIDKKERTIDGDNNYKDDLREFKDFCSDIVNYQIFSHTGAFSFMYLVNKVFSDTLNEYKAKKLNS